MFGVFHHHRLFREGTARRSPGHPSVLHRNIRHVTLEPDTASARSIGSTGATRLGRSNGDGKTAMAQEQSARFRKIGRLATETGVTVRTLHHYDHLGLVCPSERTTAGHRLHDTGDVQRLYQVLALRQLGLSLESTSTVLEGKLPLGELLERHRGHLDRQLAVIRNLRAQLDTMITQVNAPDGATVTDFTELIQKVVTVDETIRNYFSETKLAELAQRRGVPGRRPSPRSRPADPGSSPGYRRRSTRGRIPPPPRPGRWPASGRICCTGSTAATTTCGTRCTGCSPTTPRRSGSSTAAPPGPRWASSRVPVRRGRAGRGSPPFRRHGPTYHAADRDAGSQRCWPNLASDGRITPPIPPTLFRGRVRQFPGTGIGTNTASAQCHSRRIPPADQGLAAWIPFMAGDSVVCR